MARKFTHISTLLQVQFCYDIFLILQFLQASIFLNQVIFFPSRKRKLVLSKPKALTWKIDNKFHLLSAVYFSFAL